MRTIKLMADYDSFPLWEASPGMVGNINPGELPLSNELRSRLDRWAAEFDSTLDRDNPVASGFSSDEARARFKEMGRQIGAELKRELGPEYKIIVKV